MSVVGGERGKLSGSWYHGCASEVPCLHQPLHCLILSQEVLLLLVCEQAVVGSQTSCEELAVNEETYFFSGLGLSEYGHW